MDVYPFGEKSLQLTVKLNYLYLLLLFLLLSLLLLLCLFYVAYKQTFYSPKVNCFAYYSRFMKWSKCSVGSVPCRDLFFSAETLKIHTSVQIVCGGLTERQFRNIHTYIHTLYFHSSSSIELISSRKKNT